jgi:hypothetical protein
LGATFSLTFALPRPSGGVADSQGTFSSTRQAQTLWVPTPTMTPPPAAPTVVFPAETV